MEEQVKLRKVEPISPFDAEGAEVTCYSAAKAATTWPQSGVVDLAAWIGLPLEKINSWSVSENHLWLKAMLTKHFEVGAWCDNGARETLDIGEAKRALDSIEMAMLCHPGLTLDSLIGMLEREFDWETAQRLRGELTVWRQAAANDSLRKVKRPSGSAVGVKKRASADIGGACCGGRGAEGDLLWQHILRLLMTNDPCVCWLQPAGLGYFRFVLSTAAAKSWGRTKKNEHMSFEKMSRSIRQYYRQKSGVIQKVSNKARLQYKFNMSHPDVVRFILENFPNSRASDAVESGKL